VATEEEMKELGIVDRTLKSVDKALKPVDDFFQAGLKGFVASGQRRIEEQKTLTDSGVMFNYFPKEILNTDPHAGVLDSHLKNIYTLDAANNLTDEDKILNAYYLQDGIRRVSGDNLSEDQKNYSSRKAIAAIHADMESRNLSEDQIQEITDRATERYKNDEIPNDPGADMEKLQKTWSRLGAEYWTKQKKVHNIYADRLVENTKDLFKFPARSVLLNIALPKEAVFDLPSMFMSQERAAGYERRLQNPFSDEAFQYDEDSGLTGILGKFDPGRNLYRTVQSGMYHFGKIFQDVVEDALPYGGDLKYNKSKADKIDVAGQIATGGGAEFLYKTSGRMIKYLKDDAARESLTDVLESDLKGIFGGNTSNRTSGFIDRQTAKLATKRKYGITKEGARSKLLRMNELDDLGVDAYKMNVAKDIALISTGMAGTYAALETAGENWALNDSMVYQFLKFPLLALGGVGFQKIAPSAVSFIEPYQGATGNLIHKMAMTVSGEDMTPKNVLVKALGYDEDHIKNLDDITAEELLDVSQQDNSSVIKFSATLKKLENSVNAEDRLAAKSVIDSYNYTLNLRNDILDIVARRNNFSSVDDLFKNAPQIAGKADMTLDQILTSDILRAIRLEAKQEVDIGLKQGLDLLETEANTSLRFMEREKNQRELITGLFNDILGDPSDQKALEGAEDILSTIRKRNDDLLQKTNKEIEAFEDSMRTAGIDMEAAAKTDFDSLETLNMDESLLLRNIPTEEIVYRKRDTINTIDNTYVPEKQKTVDQLDEFGDRQKTYISNARKTARDRKDKAYEAAFQDVGQEKLQGTDFKTYAESLEDTKVKKDFVEFFDYVSESSFGRDRAGAVKGMAGTPDMGYAINRYVKQVQLDFVNAQGQKQETLLNNLKRMTQGANDPDALNEKLLENINNNRQSKEPPLNTIESLEQATMTEIKSVSNSLINRAEQFGIAEGESLIRLDDLHFMKKGIDKRLRAIGEGGGDMAFDLAQTSDRLKELLDMGSEMVAMKNPNIVIKTYKDASNVYHNTYIKPYRRGEGFKPFKKNVEGDVVQPEADIFRDFLTSADDKKAMAQLDQILKDGGEDGALLIRQSIAEAVDKDMTINPKILRRLEDAKIIDKRTSSKVAEYYDQPFSKNLADEISIAQTRVNNAFKQVREKAQKEDRLFNLLGNQPTDDYSQLFKTLNSFARGKDGGVQKLDATMKDIAKYYDGANPAEQLANVKRDFKAISTQQLYDDAARKVNEIVKTDYNDWLGRNKNMLGGMSKADRKIAFQEEIDAIAFSEAYKKNKSLYEYLDKEHADDLGVLLDFTTVVGRDASSIPVRGVSRAMSLESGMSRVYGIARGVVSLRYVASELTIQAFRRKRLALLQEVINNPRSADVLARAMQKDAWKSVRYRNKWISIIRGAFAIFPADASDEEILAQASKQYGFTISA
jgi:hypothetical protein